MKHAAVVPPRPVRILVVEDETLIQMLLVDYLDELGFVSDVAETAAEARARLCTLGGELNAVIMDLGLPDAVDGALVEEFRGLRPTLPIVISSGYDIGTLEARFSGLHAHEFLIKPFRIDDVRAALARLGIAGRDLPSKP